MRRVLVALALGVVLAIVGAGHLAASASSSAGTATIADAIALVHSARGASDLVERGDLNAVAQRHAERMAAENRLFHNPSLGREVTGYELVGENVGVGPELGMIHEAFLDSPSHRANILETRFTEIGIGLATGGDGALWIVQVFRQPIAPAPAPAPAPTPAPAPAPARAPAPAPAPVVEAAAVAPASPAPAPAPAPVAPAPVPAAPAVEEPAVDLTPDLVRALTDAFVWPEAGSAVRSAAASIESEIDVRDASGGRAVPLSKAALGVALLLFVGTRTLRVALAGGVGSPRLVAA